MVPRHLRDGCVLFSSGREQVHPDCGEHSPAPCTGQLWVADGRQTEESNREWGERQDEVEKKNEIK